MKLKTISLINPYCHRLCFFALPADYNPKGKSIEKIYEDAEIASFNREEVSRYAIKNNLKTIRQ